MRIRDRPLPVVGGPVPRQAVRTMSARSQRGRTV
ncbi:hypothetical protein PMO31116_02722 [Pandoraea morbifera]|uniref:Uncharacterized protein n=1 Tax=Pandoraea morbifera TaxID=2508300 RepID=A0A5E4VN07_9BURK|nr:hypothetical protein PMO31116_02722 [Pandoraea morbifera]